jgi:hypothetical protein
VIWISISARCKDFFHHHFQTGSGVHLAFCPTGTMEIRLTEIYILCIVLIWMSSLQVHKWTLMVWSCGSIFSCPKLLYGFLLNMFGSCTRTCQTNLVVFRTWPKPW